MKSSLIVVLIALTAAIIAVEEDTSSSLQTCSYWSSSGNQYRFYGLGYFGVDNYGWMNATDTKGNVWSFQVCQYYAINSDDVDNSYNPCPTGSSVCVAQSEDGQILNRGSASTAKFNDLPNEAEGFEVMFGSSDDDEVKTVIDFVCSAEDYVPVITSIQSDDKFTTITVNSTEACQTEIWYGDDGDYESNTVRIDGGFLFFALVFLVGACCSLCCCCCLARRRRVQRNKDIAMKQFSNIAFQPIPSANKGNVTGVHQQTVPLPAYNPYLVQQPQFVYYYPHQQQQQVQPPIVPLQVVDNDEKLAKELQAQFDREAQV